MYMYMYMYMFDKNIRYITNNNKYSIIKLCSNPYVIYDELKLNYDEVFKFIKNIKNFYEILELEN